MGAFDRSVQEQLFGAFLLGWSTIESTLEVAIGRQLGLGAYESSLVTAGLGFRDRSRILLSLLQRDEARNSGAIRALRAIQETGERNAFVHGHIRYEGERLVIDYRRSDRGLRIRRYEYTVEELQSLVLRTSRIAEDLRSALGLSEADVTSFFTEAFSRRQSSSMSP